MVAMTGAQLALAQQSSESDSSSIALPSPRLTDLARAIAAGDGDACDRFWIEIDGHAPLIEPDPERDDRTLVTFLFRGSEVTRAVALSGAAPELDAPVLLAPLDGTDLWYRSQSMPSDSRLIYSFRELWGDEIETSLHAQIAGVNRAPRQPDALSDRPRRQNDQATYLELPGAKHSPWLEPADPARASALETRELESEILGETRTLYVYTPPAFEAGQGDHPVLVVFDGGVAGADPEGALIPTPTILDNLTEAGEIPACIALLIPNASRDARTRDLTCSEDFTAFLADELLPWARREFSATSDPSKTLVTGVSFGGLAAVYAGLQRPEVFGLILAQSPSLWHAPDVYDPTHDFTSNRGWLVGAYARAERLPARIYMCVGTMEQFNYRSNMTRLCRSLHAVLIARGAEVTYREYNAGHIYEMWANDLPEGLVSLLGGSGGASGSGGAARAPGD